MLKHVERNMPLPCLSYIASQQDRAISGDWIHIFSSFSNRQSSKICWPKGRVPHSVNAFTDMKPFWWKKPTHFLDWLPSLAASSCLNLHSTRLLCLDTQNWRWVPYFLFVKSSSILINFKFSWFKHIILLDSCSTFSCSNLHSSWFFIPIS